MKLSQKHPVIAAVFWALQLLVFYFIAGYTVSITKALPVEAMLIRAVCVFAACLLAVVYIWRSAHSISDYGFNRLTKTDLRRILFFLPILAIEAVPLFAGFRDNADLAYITAVLACTLCVGFAEEVYFRGFVLNILKAKGIRFSIVVSSIIFGLGHLINIAGGTGFAETVLQIFFAFLFGFVCAEIVVITGSIVPAILWHFIHDFLAYITDEGSTSFIIAAAFIQTVILITFAVYLYKNLLSQSRRCHDEPL